MNPVFFLFLEKSRKIDEKQEIFQENLDIPDKSVLNAGLFLAVIWENDKASGCEKGGFG